MWQGFQTTERRTSTMTINDAMIELCEDCDRYDWCSTPCDKFVEAVTEKEDKEE